MTRPTPPPRPREKLPPNPMRDVAERRGLPVHRAGEHQQRRGTRSCCGRLQPDLLVVCDYGQILSADVLGLVPLGGINLHASLLPKYRGAAPIHWAILNGETETGVTRDPHDAAARWRADPGRRARHDHRLRRNASRAGSSGWRDSASSRCTRRLALLANWDRKFAHRHAAGRAASDQGPAPEEGARRDRLVADRPSRFATRCGHSSLGRARYTFWHRPGHEPLRIVIDQVSSTARGTRAAILGAGLEADATPAGHLPADPFDHGPGHVVICDGKQLIVATGDGGLSLLAVQPAGKKVMPIDQFLRGYHVRVGDRLGPA